MDNSGIISAIDDTTEYRCNICDHKSFTKSFPGLIQCTNCDFITANVTLTLEDIHRLYGASYFSGDEYADYLGDKKIIKKNLSNWLAIIRKYVDSGNLIEIGSAYGFFLEIASEHFHSQGYEISKSAAQYSRDVTNVTTSNLDFLDEKEIADGSVDVAVMWDVIEHLSDPAAVLEKLRAVLKHNGHIFITTGDIDSKLAKAQGKTWRMIHPPSHLQYFSRTTLTHLLNTKGFEVIDVKYPGYWRSMGQIIHGLFILGSNERESFMYRFLCRIIPKRLGIYLNTYDIMLVTAKLTNKISVDTA